MIAGGTELLKAEHRTLVFQKGQRIFQEGDPAEAIYVVQTGCVRLQVHDEQGGRHVVAFFFAGDLICGGLSTYWATAEAVTTCALARSSKATLLQSIVRDLETRTAMIAASQQALSNLAHHISRLVHWSAAERFSWFIQSMAKRTRKPGSDLLHLPMERQDIADFLALAPETVSRLFSQLEATGELVRVEPHHYRWSPQPRLARNRQAEPALPRSRAAPRSGRRSA